jgi:hypothetical protein
MEVRRFRSSRMLLPEIPGALAHPQRSEGRAARVCFLLVTFLCTSKEK